MKPILFNTEMVRAILEGRKTVTRRVVRYDFSQLYASACTHRKWGEGYGTSLGTVPESLDEWYVRKAAKPPYHPGEILWVRETWQFIPCIDCRMDMNGICGDTPVSYEDRDMVGEGCFVYRADYPEPGRLCWRASIHMPREAARLFLRVTEVQVERLQDMTEENAIMEGLKDSEAGSDSLLTRFSELWDRTVKREDILTLGWDANPWVWVIEFEPCGKPEEENKR